MLPQTLLNGDKCRVYATEKKLPDVDAIARLYPTLNTAHHFIVC